MDPTYHNTELPSKIYPLVQWRHDYLGGNQSLPGKVYVTGWYCRSGKNVVVVSVIGLPEEFTTIMLSGFVVKLSSNCCSYS